MDGGAHVVATPCEDEASGVPCCRDAFVGNLSTNCTRFVRLSWVWRNGCSVLLPCMDAFVVKVFGVAPFGYGSFFCVSY